MTRTWRDKYGYRVVALLLPLMLVVWFFGGLTPLDTHELPFFYNVSSDQVQQVWFLSWPAHAIAHGLNPFVSGSLNAPHGVNLMSNTAMVLLGILMAPVTWVLGPLSAFVAVCEGGIVFTTWSLTWVMRRLGVGRAGSLVAGLLFGFNPLAVAAVTVHPYLAFKPFMPLVAYWLYRILASSTSRWRDGVWLGICVAGMFLVMQEAAGASLYVGAIVLLVAAIIWRSQLTIDAVRERLRLVAVGAVTALALLAYPLWIMFAGPWHVVGKPHEFLGDFHADALAFVVAPGTFNGSLLGMSGVVNSLRITPWENGVYIGPLILVLVAGWWWRRHSGVAWWLGISGLAIASLVLGAHLSIAGHQTSLPLPMSLLQHLPLGSEVIPARFMSFLWLLVAVAVGLIINELLVTHQGRVAVSSLRTVVAWGAIVLGLFFVAPSSMNDRWTPPHQAALTSSRFAALVPSGSVVLTYPYASAINSEAMTDLALAANRYRLIGGRAMVPSPGTGKSQSIAPLAPFGVFNTFLHAQFSTAELGFAQLALNQPVGTADTDAQFHVDLIRFISRYHVTDVVATPTGPGASHIRVLLTSTLGAPQRVGRVWVWVVRPSSIH